MVQFDRHPEWWSEASFEVKHCGDAFGGDLPRQLEPQHIDMLDDCGRNFHPVREVHTQTYSTIAKHERSVVILGGHLDSILTTTSSH